MSPDSGPVREIIDKSRWPRLSPLLDELLDMEPAARATRLAAMRNLEPELAADLELLLARDAELAGNAFLAAAAPPPTLTAVVPLPGQLVGAYRLEREIGQGGMGTVWLARRTDGRFEGQVAVKFLASGLLGHGDAGRFAREGQILARLTHPNIARLIDAGVAQDGLQPYLVLEFVEDGLAIDRFCETQRLDTTQRVTLFLDVLAAVAHAHNRLILHRDLKPGNILVDRQGQVKLLDFGIAKLLGDHTQPAEATELTRRAGRAFTPQFAAPEQVQGGDVTTATDVYALGVLLYLLLGGGHPTNTVPAGPPNHKNTGTALEQLRTVVEVEPRRLSDAVRAQPAPEAKKQARELRGDLDTIVAKALKKAPAERYANAAALADDLKRWLAHEPIAARPDSRSYRLLKFLRRHRLGVAAGSLAGLSLAVGIALALWKGQEAQQQRVQAEGLIEFMLGDLRKKLEPVGRLDVLDAVGDKALDYYARQDLARSDADSLGRRARALHLMGEIAEKRGQMAEAEQRFKQAADSTAELLARDPKNTQRLFDHAQSSYWVGYAAWQQRRLPEAEAGFQRYLALAKELVALEPGKMEWRTELAYAQQNMGVLKLRGGATDAAQLHLQATLSVWQDLAPQHAALQADLANTLGWLAEAQERQGQFDASISSHQKKLTALQAAGGQTNNDSTLQDQRAATETVLGRLHFSAGRIDAAIAVTRQARDKYVELAALDRDNLDMLERLAFARQQLAEILIAQGDLAPAKAELALLQLEINRLLRAESRKPDWWLTLHGRWLMARLAVAAAHDERARQHTLLAEFLASTTDAKQDELGSDARAVLSSAAMAMGDDLALTDAKAARTYWQAALANLKVLADTTDPRVTCLRAHALMRLGRTQEARALADKLQVSAYRHPLYAELRRSLQP